MKYEDMKDIIGKRVEIPVHYDLWMRGAQTGKIVGRNDSEYGISAYVLVKMDHPQVKHRVKVWSHDIEYMKFI
jgi:hypothetical protein